MECGDKTESDRNQNPVRNCQEISDWTKREMGEIIYMRNYTKNDLLLDAGVLLFLFTAVLYFYLVMAATI